MAKDYQSEIAHNWQSKEHKNNKKTPKNGSHTGLQSLPDILQHPVYVVSEIDDKNIKIWKKNYNTMTYPRNSCFVTQLVKPCCDIIKSQNDVNVAFQSLIIIIGKYRSTF